MKQKTQTPAPTDDQLAPTGYQPPAIHTLTLAALWQRLGPAVAVTTSPDLFDSLVPSDPADGLFDD